MPTATLSPGLFGWHTFGDHHEADGGVLQNMRAAFNSAYTLSSINQTKSACATTGDITSFGTNNIATIVGNPSWKDKTLHQVSTSRGNAVALAEAYSHHGLAFTEKLNGDFVCAIVDNDNDRIILVTDRFGRHPLYYCKTDGGVIFATTPSPIHSHPTVKQELLQQGIYNYVYFHMVPSPSTIYRNIHKLPAATLIDIHSDRFEYDNYWVPSFTNSSSSSFRSLGLELKKLLKQAVEKELDSPLTTGAFLSGGLDSSTVVGMFSELSKNQAEALMKWPLLE